MALFTVILEFEGTTSVSQFTASGLAAAFQKWVQGLAERHAYGLDRNQARAVAKAIADQRQFDNSVQMSTLSRLDGVENVRQLCTDAKRPRRPLMINIVATVPKVARRRG